MNEWIYRNSMVEYEQRLKTIDNERRARKLSAQRPQTKVLSTIISELKAQFSQSLRRQREEKAASQLRVRG